jgi:hypothetical protein
LLYGVTEKTLRMGSSARSERPVFPYFEITEVTEATEKRLAGPEVSGELRITKGCALEIPRRG